MVNILSKLLSVMLEEDECNRRKKSRESQGELKVPDGKKGCRIKQDDQGMFH